MILLQNIKKWKMNIVFFNIILLSAHFSLMLIEFLSGVISMKQYLQNIDAGLIIFQVISLLGGGLLFTAVLYRLKSKNNYKLMLAYQLLSILWAVGSNFTVAFLFHSSELYSGFSNVRLYSAYFCGSIGLYFGAVFMIAAVDEVEQLLKHEDGDFKLARRLRNKFISSIPVSIWSFVGITVSGAMMMKEFGLDSSAIFARIFIISFPLALVSVVMIHFLLKSTTSPLVSSIGIFKALGNNDLTKSLSIQRFDEIGLLFTEINKFLGNLRSAIGTISRKTVETAAGSADMILAMKQSRESSEEAKEISAGIENIIASQNSIIDELSSNVEEVVKTIENQDAKISGQSASVAESSSAIEEMIANIRSISKNLESSNVEFDRLKSSVNDGSADISELGSYINSLSEKSSRVSEANSIVSNIAAQTNLLAMNAAIEAAHAGEAGKGFSVVADEIRKLAETANVQSKQISAEIRSLTESISSVHSISGRTGKSFSVIRDSVRTVTDIDSQITQALQELSAGSSQILESLDNIKQITEEIHNGSEEMVVGSRESLNEIANLIELSAKSNNSVKEVINKIAIVNDNIAKTAGGVNTTAGNIQEIRNQVSNFEIE